MLQADGVEADGTPFSSTCLLNGTWYALNAWADSAGTLQTGWAGQRATNGSRIQVDCRTWD